MIKYNLNTINDWNFGDDNIIKVYRNNAVCYYKITGGGDTPTAQTPCFAVVDDITQYQETEFEDVYDKATEKWYKLNNLNQYEQYGIYGSGRTITTYDGKLTVDEEASPSRLPSGYTEVEYIENTGTSYINTDLQIYSSTTNSFEVEAKLIAAKHDSQSYQNVFSCMSEDGEPYQGFAYRYNFSSLVGTSIPNGQNTFTIVNNEDSTQTVTVTSSTSQRTYTHTYPLTLFCGLNSSRSPFRWTNSKFYYCKIKMNNELVRDLVPCKRDSDNKYGMYDIVNDVFYVSPNNVDFSGGEPIIQPTKTYEYQYSGGSWVNVGEVTGSTASLPDVPFTVNYNAKNYDASTQTLIKTSGQLADVDAVITAGTPTVGDGYLTIATNTRATIEGYSQYFSRANNSPNLTIISKQLTDGNNCHMFANRDSNYNWMYRCYSNKLTLHGATEQGSVAVTTQPVIESVRIDSNRLATYNNYTDNTTSTQSNFSYGSTNGSVALFAGYTNNTGEWFVGDFYWIYMSQTTLTDEQVQQVIAYNEGSGGTSYPLYYDEMQDPPNNLTFSSMAEAEAYECPWVGMRATIAGSAYTFNENYEWELNTDIWVNAQDTIASTSGSNNVTITSWVTNRKFPKKITIDKNTSGGGSYCWGDFKKTDDTTFLSIPTSTEMYFILEGVSYQLSNPSFFPSYVTYYNGILTIDLEAANLFGSVYFSYYQKNFLVGNINMLFAT